MRIQHNIMSMNAYRNYNNNASALGKNLEKLSSGYKINRAGDDAAGLAISEKMRAQIKGLDAATKNVKDGISLVKTAEGAMQEIQDMLSRMKYLATQSANGTYDDDVDRKALQNEVDQLNSEINRIADSANFNGTKLLDGSLAGGGSTTGKKVAAPVTGNFDFQVTNGSKAVHTLKFAGKSDIKEGTITFSISINGTAKQYTLDVKKNSTGALSIFNGDEEIGTAGTYATGTLNVEGSAAALSSAAMGEFLAAKLTEDFGSQFTIAASGAGVKVTALENGANTIAISGTMTYSKTNNGTQQPSEVVSGTSAQVTAGKDDLYKYTVTNFKVTSKASEMNVYTLNGVKFAFINASQSDIADEIDKMTDKNVHLITVAGANVANTDTTKIAAELSQLTGSRFAATGADITYLGTKAGATGGAGGGLQLQIGDTGDSYNQLDVVVKDLHAAAVGCAGVDISTIGGAQAAIDTVKDCINYVSEIRGKLGATQNRLEHTQNNLSVMKENIQDAESTIRDTDVADEMMAYTKNNILIQSAQAMLAQANAVPQGVLQLLQ